MDEALKKYRALSVADKRAADLVCRTKCNNRTLAELFEAGAEVTAWAIEEAVRLGREMLADGFTEEDALECAMAGR